MDISYVLPMSIFSMFLIFTCSEINSKIKFLHRDLGSKSNASFVKFLRNYSWIRSKVEDIDDTFSFLIFLSTILNSMNMYYFLKSCIDSNGLKVIHWKLFYFFYSFLFFIATIISATSVSETSQKLIDRAKTVETSTETSLTKILILNSEKDICFTVWKITPIRRNFIFGIFGLIISYVGLFYSLDG